jgi:hypothetical protein
MEDVGYGNNEDDSGYGYQYRNAPNSPYESATRISYAEKGDTDAGFDGYGTSCVEELGDEKELDVMAWSALRYPHSRELRSYLSPLHDVRRVKYF